jgi:RNA-directed DNA polymerase
MTEGQGEAPDAEPKETELLVAKPAPESPASAEQLMEEVCNRENLQRAWKRVRRNKGGPGVNGMTIDDAKAYLREHWPSIRSHLLEGPTSRSRSNGSKYLSRMAGSESSARLASSTD